MNPRVRILGTDKVEIYDLDGWLAHAGPEKGIAQWRDGYSAKEQAKAWLRPGSPAVPEEVLTVLGEEGASDFDEVYARPEHQTRLDKFSRARQHDMLACLRADGSTVLVVGIEAKACESFDGTVADRAASRLPSRKRARCNLMSRALFGRGVIDEDSGDILDAALAAHGYQLWTAAVGTLIEAQSRDQDAALLLVHQFAPADIPAARAAGDRRGWHKALAANEASYDTFAAAVAAAGSHSHQTDFVGAGTRLHVRKVLSPLPGHA